jgi:ABC-type transporter Mla MlaB component
VVLARRRPRDILPVIREVRVASALPEERILPAPEHLGLDTRSAFRKDAVRLLDSMNEGAGRLTIDLAATRGVDSSGLNALILVRRHATRRRLAVRLKNVSEELRFLLVLTKLDAQFDLANIA